MIRSNYHKNYYTKKIHSINNNNNYNNNNNNNNSNKNNNYHWKNLNNRDNKIKQIIKRHKNLVKIIHQIYHFQRQSINKN
jgi:DNA-directed RNA polymerase specialized sigma54-like protein